MDTSNTDLLRQFYSVLNRKLLTEDVLNNLLKRWGLENVNLDEEQNKINQKISKLSRSKRDAIPEFIILKKMLEDKKNENLTNMDMNVSDQNIANDQITL